MGKFIYESTVKVDFEDRLLAHLQIVIGTKLRRGEAFHFTWKDDANVGSGRTVVWVHPRVSLVYKYYGSRMPAIDPAWVEALMFAANSPAGLYCVPQPPPGSAHADGAGQFGDHGHAGAPPSHADPY